MYIQNKYFNVIFKKRNCIYYSSNSFSLLIKGMCCCWQLQHVYSNICLHLYALLFSGVNCVCVQNVLYKCGETGAHRPPAGDGCPRDGSTQISSTLNTSVSWDFLSCFSSLLKLQVKLAYDLDGRWRTFLHKNGKHNFKTRLQNYNSVNNLSLFFV